MRFISTRAHSLIDYMVAVILLGLPYLFGAWAGGGAKVWLPMILGTAIIVYSLLTDYELSVIRLIPMPLHLLIDAAGGALLAVSPFLFGFAQDIWIPFVIIGLMEIGLSLITKTVPGALPGLQPMKAQPARSSDR